MIDIPYSPTYQANRNKYGIGSEMPCIICCKPMKKPYKHMLHIWDGACIVKEEEVPDLDPAGDTGFYPVGSDCLRKHPELKEYL